jgi:glycosyltransferase involved in cell wall biosynthesis
MTSIMQVAPSLDVGGLERVVSNLSIELVHRGWDVSVHSPGGEPFEGFLEDHDVPTQRIPAPLPRLDSQFAAARVLSRQIRRRRPAVIHAHNPAAAAAARLATWLARLPETPIVATYHGLSDGRLRRAAMILRAAATVTVGCGENASAEIVRAGVSADRVATVVNGIDPPSGDDACRIRSEFGVETAPLVVNVGRYAEQKNQQLLVRAFSSVVQTLPSAKLLVVGTGPAEPELRRLVHALGLGESVVITGRRDDAPAIIAAADVFVLPSLFEGLPLALLEAMSSGRAIVATRVRGVEGLVEPDVTGRLVPSGSADGLAEAVLHLLRDGSERDRLGRAAAEAVRSGFSVSAMTTAYESVYRAVLAGAPLSSATAGRGT